jgi:ornithine carbamoyltransferase
MMPLLESKPHKRDFLKITDAQDHLLELLQSALSLKESLGKNGKLDVAHGKTLGLIFEKPSTRTRVSFELAMKKLGGDVLVLQKNDIQMGRGETIKDTALVLSGFLDAIMYRAFKADDVRELARHATVPVINGLDDEEHPCQIAADFLTLLEQFGSLKGLEFVYVGDGDNNMAHTYRLGAPLVGMNVKILAPKGYQPGARWVERAEKLAAKHGTKVFIGTLTQRNLVGADVIATDTWVSMGDEKEERTRLKAFKGYTVDERMLAATKKHSTVFLHCLPAHYGHECTENVAHGPQSLVFQEAENRLWAQMAVLVDLLSLSPPGAVSTIPTTTMTAPEAKVATTVSLVRNFTD